MSKESQMYVDMIIQTKQWFDVRKKELETVAKGIHKISFQGSTGKSVELPEHMKDGFFFGIKTALEIFGEFPISISKNEDDENEDNDEN